MKARTPFDHLDRAYAHLAKACSQLTRHAGRVSGSDDAAQFGSVKAALDATKAARKATGAAREAGRMTRDAGLRLDTGSEVGGLLRSARQNADHAHRYFFDDGRDQRKARLQACIDVLDRLTECDRGELQKHFKRGRRLDELLAVFRAAAGVKELRIAEYGLARPTGGDTVSLADEIICKVMLLRRRIVHRSS